MLSYINTNGWKLTTFFFKLVITGKKSEERGQSQNMISKRKGESKGKNMIGLLLLMSVPRDFLGGAVVKNLPASAGDMGLIPGPGRSHMPRTN